MGTCRGQPVAVPGILWDSSSLSWCCLKSIPALVSLSSSHEAAPWPCSAAISAQPGGLCLQPPGGCFFVIIIVIFALYNFLAPFPWLASWQSFDCRVLLPGRSSWSVWRLFQGVGKAELHLLLWGLWGPGMSPSEERQKGTTHRHKSHPKGTEFPNRIIPFPW